MTWGHALASLMRVVFLEKMAKLDAYTRNVYSKKLFQLQLTYDALQAIFENSCSYMDFYEALQDRGIDRKTAKHFASQFGSMGLRNQGTEPYCSLPKSTAGLDYSLDNVDLLMVEKETKRPPNVPPLPPTDNDVVIECSECWEDELDESRTFTFTIPKPVPALSLTIDDFASPSSSKSSNNAKTKSSSKQNGPGYAKSKPGNKIEIAKGSKRNSEKDELGKARVNDITKTDEVITTESSIHENSGFQKSEAKPNETEASEKSKTNSKKFPRKFLGKTRRNFGNKRDSHPRKNLSASGGQAGTAVAKRNEKENKEMSEDQREKVKRLKGETGDERSKEGTQTAAEITRTTQAVALQEQKNTKTAPENRLGQKDTTVFKKCSIGKKDKQKEKLRRIKQQCEPVIFVNHKSVEKEQRDWRRIEIFVGDFPVQIPVDPSKVDFIEEKFDLNTESKEKDLCGSSVEKQCQENYTCGELPTQPGESEQSLEEGRSDGKVIPSNVDVVIAESPNESTLFQEQGDRNVDTKKEEAIVGNGLQGDFIREDSNVASSHEIPKKKRVEMSDSSQQTHSDWCRKEAKKLVDQEQQTDCALLSTFNTETSHVQMQDKETLTDRCRRAQSTDTVSSYGDNLSDSYTTSPSSPLYPCDFDPQYDFNTEELTREYESPLRVFDISMSPHQENRYVGEDIHYPENDTQYLNENSRYHDEDIRYEIPSPKNNEEFSYTHEYQHIPRVYHNPSSHPNAWRERFHLRPTAPPPIYPAIPDSAPAVPMFHPRFPQPYISHLKYFTSSPPWSSEVLRNNGQCESLRK